MSQSAQSYAPDPRNDHVLVHVNGQMLPRDRALVSVFDAGFALGDGVWEGLRLSHGRLIQLDAHLDRLFQGAHAIALDIPQGRAGIIAALDQTLAANAMTDGAHLRLMVTRGVKSTINQDPRFVTSGPTVVITAEWKRPNPALQSRGLTLFTSSLRTSGPDVFDMRLNSHSRLNLIQALNQAIAAGADEALMLDPHGFVASCNSTNFFIIRNGELWTSSGRYSFQGITQATICALARADGIRVQERDFTLAQTYSADEAFVSGTLGGITPVARVDGHALPAPLPGPLTAHLAALYKAHVAGA